MVVVAAASEDIVMISVVISMEPVSLQFHC